MSTYVRAYVCAGECRLAYTQKACPLSCGTCVQVTSELFWISSMPLLSIVHDWDGGRATPPCMPPIIPTPINQPQNTLPPVLFQNYPNTNTPLYILPSPYITPYTGPPLAPASPQDLAGSPFAYTPLSPSPQRVVDPSVLTPTPQAPKKLTLPPAVFGGGSSDAPVDACSIAPSGRTACHPFVSCTVTDAGVECGDCPTGAAHAPPPAHCYFDASLHDHAAAQGSAATASDDRAVCRCRQHLHRELPHQLSCPRSTNATVSASFDSLTSAQTLTL